MDLLRRALLAAITCSWLFLSGCGTYRPVASILPLAPGNPQLTDTVAVYNVNPNTNNVAGALGTMTILSVAGDSNLGNYQVGANDTLTAAPPLNTRLITFAGGNTYTAAANPAQGAPNVSAASVTLVNTLTGSSQKITLPAEFTPTFITATATTNLILVSLQPLSTATTFPTCGAAGIGAIGIISTATATLNATACVKPVAPVTNSNPGFIQVMLSDSVAFVLDQAGSSVSALNLTTPSLASTTSPVGAVGTNPIWATTSVDGNTLYVLNQGSNSVSVIDAVAQTVSPTSITTGNLSNPSIIITDRSLNRLYISNNNAPGTVSVRDASTAALTELKSVSVGANPVGLAVTPDGNSVYVANTGSNFVSVINANSFNVTSLTPIGSSIDASAKIQAVAVSKDGTKAYMAVTVISDLSNANNTSGNGVFVVLTSTNAFVTNASGNQINIAPPQDLSCDATESCTGALLQRPVQIVPRI